MRKLLVVIAVGAFLALPASACLARSKDSGKTLTLQATVPVATSVGITVTRVEAATDTWLDEVPGDNPTLNFGLQYDSSEDTFFADYYYVVDVGVQGGAGAPETTLHYTEGSNPNAPSTGLGTRGSADFRRMAVSELGIESQSAIPGHPKTIFSNVQNKTIASDLLQGGWLRIFLGLNSEESGSAEVFSTQDAPGTYDGTMTITAVVN